MSLLLIGANHRTAPLAVRERLVFPPGGFETALGQLRDMPQVEEAMILSTCNRTEILLRTESPSEEAVDAVKGFLSRERGFDREELDRILYVKRELEAVRHLFRLEAGLDSMILGEPQILGQVKDAYESSAVAGSLGSRMQALLQRSFSVAKKVRTSTEIGRSPVSVAYAAVDLAEQIFGELDGRSVLSLGAGETAELALRHLRAHGIQSVFVANRTYSRAEELARRFDGEPVPYDRFLEHLERVDILVSSTAAPHAVLSYENAVEVIRRRRNRPLFLIDIAVPRDVDPKVNEIDNIYLYDVDDLQHVADAGLKERQLAAEQAERIIDREVEAYRVWARAQEVAPTIVALRDKLHSLRKGEIDRFHGRLRQLPPDQRRAVEELAASLINKVLHGPIRHLKQSAATANGEDRVALVRQLFGLGSAAAEAEEPQEPQDLQEATTGEAADEPRSELDEVRR